MSSDTADTAVRTEIAVDVPLERAFRVFTERFDHIKPREHNMLAVDIAQSVFEPKVGGRIYDRGVDGSECQWGRVLAYPQHQTGQRREGDAGVSCGSSS